MITGVVKIGGSSGNSLERLLEEMEARFRSGEKWILVHGASSRMDSVCTAAGVEPLFVTSPSGFRSRFVGEAEMEIFETVALAETSRICSRLGLLGVPAVPVDTVTLGVILAETKDCLRESREGKVRILRGNRSGKITRIHGEYLGDLLERGFLPVIPPLAREEGTKRAVNIDGDRAAASIAGTVGSKILVLLTNVPGVLRDPGDVTTLIPEARPDDLAEIGNYAKGNMKRKVLACREAIASGVPEAVISDSRVDLPLTAAMERGGTRFCRVFFTGIAV